MAKRQTFASTETVLQIEATECGAACLSMILQYYGQYVPLEQLRAETDVSRDGSSARNIVKAAIRRGLQCDGYQIDTEDLQELSPPCILWWQRNHFVVYEGMKGGFCYINDPAYGRRRIDMQSLERDFSEVVLVFSPGEDFKDHPEYGARPDSFLRSGRIGILLRSHGFLVAAAAFSGLFATAAGLAAAMAPDIFFPGPGWRPTLPMGYFAICLLCYLIAHLVCEHLLRLIEDRNHLAFSWRFLGRLFAMPVSFYEQRSPEDLVERVRRNDRISRFTGGSLLRGGIAAGSLILCLIASAAYSYGAPVLILICLALAFLSQQWMEKRIAFDETRASISLARLAETVLSGMGKLETILNLNMGMKFAEDADRQQEEAARIRDRIRMVRMTAAALRFVIYGCCLAGLIGMGGPWQPALPPYTWLVIFLVLVPAAESLTGTVMKIRRAGEETASVDDIMPLKGGSFSEEEEAGADRFRKLQGNIRCRNVPFSYGAFGEPIIEKENLYLPVSSSLAVTGLSGSGKSTFARLLGGLLSPTEGMILYDEKPAEEVPDQVIFASIAMVKQKSELFEGTIRDNITMWNPNISEEDLWRAIEDAAVTDCIRQRPDGLETVLGERGTGLSGGERQRLEIARALATNPTILILDEAFSAVDDDTTERIIANIRRRGCTLIIVTHDPLLIEECDRQLRLGGDGGES